MRIRRLLATGAIGAAALTALVGSTAPAMAYDNDHGRPSHNRPCDHGQDNDHGHGQNHGNWGHDQWNNDGWGHDQWNNDNWGHDQWNNHDGHDGHDDHGPHGQWNHH